MKGIDSTIIITLITGYLYVSGVAEINAVIANLQLDADVLGITFYSVIYNGLLLNLTNIVILFCIPMFYFLSTLIGDPKQLKFKYRVMYLDFLSRIKANNKFIFSLCAFIGFILLYILCQ